MTIKEFDEYHEFDDEIELIELGNDYQANLIITDQYWQYDVFSIY